MSEYSELKQAIENTEKKVDRLLTWAEGDKDLGTPSIKQQIDQNAKDISGVRRRTYENEERVKDVEKDVKSIKKQSGIFGVGGGGIMYTVIEAIKQIIGMN